MKLHIFFIVTIALLSIQQSIADDNKIDEWGVITNNIQISITLKDKVPAIHTNQAVNILIRFKNVSTNENYYMYWLLSATGDPRIVFTVITPSGKDISPTIDNYPTGSGYFRLIAPKQTVDMEIDLSLRCKFDEVGEYKITARRTLDSSSGGKPFVVVSNPLHVPVNAGAGTTPN